VWKKRSCISELCNTNEGLVDIENRKIRLKIGMLGDAKRRERADRYLNLYASSGIKEALTGDERSPMQFQVSEIF
jgi:hypothetical protein